MKALTVHQRELAEHRVALTLGWEMLAWVDQDLARRKARAVVRELERGAVHGASEKRALELLSIQEQEEGEA